MAQFITGELDIEKDWDNYVQTINNMRLDDMISIMQRDWIICNRFCDEMPDAAYTLYPALLKKKEEERRGRAT